MSETYVVVPAGPLVPDGLTSLADHAEREGIRIVATVLDRWRDGTERFDGPGEALLAAVSGDEVVGIGGLSRCPHVEGALRVRRFYVAPAWRRRGVARSLATDLIAAGCAHADLLTCNAGASTAAAPFWEAMGFVPVDTDGITHVISTARPGRDWSGATSRSGKVSAIRRRSRDDSEKEETMPDVKDWNTKIIEEFRANDGEVGGQFEGAPLLLLHTTGAKSGEERVNPVMYQDLGGGSVAVFASKAGAPDNPDWFHNIRAHPEVEAEIATERRSFVARVAEGDERERIWSKQKQDYPGFAEYEEKTDRVIPVVVLDPA